MEAKAMVLEKFNQPLVLKAFPLPRLKNGEVLVKIEAAGVCGSDVHMWEGRDPRIRLPMIPGHEGAGKIMVSLGSDYREYLVEYVAHNKRGSADLCTYFFLRVGQLVRQDGLCGLLATNTIAQGDTRIVGLDQMITFGWVIIGIKISTAIHARELLPTGKKYSGPAVVTEYSATTVVPEGKRFSLDGSGNLVIELG